jgi:hypothetical protein
MDVKELLAVGLKAGLNFTTAKLFIAYVIKRNFNTEGSYESWLDRFKKGTEWSFSDYTGRRVLQELSVIYPKDLDGYHNYS